jgi:hypothetical protein
MGGEVVDSEVQAMPRMLLMSRVRGGEKVKIKPTRPQHDIHDAVLKLKAAQASGWQVQERAGVDCRYPRLERAPAATRTEDASSTSHPARFTKKSIYPQAATVVL